VKVLALDLSLTATGVAFHDNDPRTWKTNCTGAQRLAQYRDMLNDVVTFDTYDIVIIEDLPMGLRNAAAGSLGMLHGVIRVLLHDYDIPVVLVPPASLKKYATGKGNAKKPDMRMALYKRTDLDLADDNQVDAVWLRHMALDHYGEPELDMPASHRAALDKISWPPVEGGPTGADITISVLDGGEGVR
jgi:Holliday junction resolvasome RuvABC endonuclease subunit